MWSDPVGSASTYDPNTLPGEYAAAYRADQTSTIIAGANPAETAAVELIDDEFADLIAFLNALTSPRLVTLAATDIPESVPSGLPVGD